MNRTNKYTISTWFEDLKFAAHKAARWSEFQINHPRAYPFLIIGY